MPIQDNETLQKLQNKAISLGAASLKLSNDLDYKYVVIYEGKEFTFGDNSEKDFIEPIGNKQDHTRVRRWGSYRKEYGTNIRYNKNDCVYWYLNICLSPLNRYYNYYTKQTEWPNDPKYYYRYFPCLLRSNNIHSRIHEYIKELKNRDSDDHCHKDIENHINPNILPKKSS